MRVDRVRFGVLYGLIVGFLSVLSVREQDAALLKRLADILLSPAGRPEQKDISTGRVLSDDEVCLLYTSPSPRDVEESRMPSSA